MIYSTGYKVYDRSVFSSMPGNIHSRPLRDIRLAGEFQARVARHKLIILERPVQCFGPFSVMDVTLSTQLSVDAECHL